MLIGKGPSTFGGVEGDGVVATKLNYGLAVIGNVAFVLKPETGNIWSKSAVWEKQYGESRNTVNDVALRGAASGRDTSG